MPCRSQPRPRWTTHEELRAVIDAEVERTQAQQRRKSKPDPLVDRARRNAEAEADLPQCVMRFGKREHTFVSDFAGTHKTRCVHCGLTLAEAEDEGR